MIERLLPPPEQRERVESTRSSISFTTVSEERLRAAVRLAKRDLRRRRLESVTASPAKPSQDASSLHETSNAELLEVNDADAWHTSYDEQFPGLIHLKKLWLLFLSFFLSL